MRTPPAPDASPTPPCFPDDHDFAKWTLFNRRSRSLRVPNFCGDCNPVYQQRMIDKDRCQFPNAKFYVFSKILKDGSREEEIVGLRMPPVAVQRPYTTGVPV